MAKPPDKPKRSPPNDFTLPAPTGGTFSSKQTADGGRYTSQQSNALPQCPARTGPYLSLIEPRRQQQAENHGQQPGEQGSGAHGNNCGI